MNPQAVVPALVLDEGGPPLFQSIAIMEYLEETKPQPPLAAEGPARPRAGRGLALIAAADGHPLVVPRIRDVYGEGAQARRAHAQQVARALDARGAEAIEGHLESEKETGTFCHGDSPTMADICLAGQVIGAIGYFKCDVSSVPTCMRIYEECMKIDAFSKPHPMKQPGARRSLVF